jgi:TPR repeat protein
MKSSWLLILLILFFPVNSAAQELTKNEVKQVLTDSNSGNPKAQAYLGSMCYSGNGVQPDHSDGGCSLVNNRH